MTTEVQEAEQQQHVLGPWGFDVHFGELFAAWCSDNTSVGAVVGRVIAWEHGIAEVVLQAQASGTQCCLCEPTGNLRRQLQERTQEAELATGDWVVVEAANGEVGCDVKGRMLHVLPRRTALRRRMAGSHVRAQTVATNVDKVFVVTSANNDFNPRRLERYLVAVWDSGATPVVVLNKIDLSDDVDHFLREIQAVAARADIVAVSAQSCAGLEALSLNVSAGETIALVGSSGVGKSSLLNRLVGREVAVTGGIDSVDKGRHTTTRRSMVLLPHGGVLIDNPGMREFGLLDSESGLDSAFPDIAALAALCRFHDCAHRGEPGCAVVAAVDQGTLDEHRVLNFHKLEREMAALRARAEPRLQSELKQGYKVRTRAHRALKKVRKSR